MSNNQNFSLLDAALVKGIVPAYIGYDATATSLHVATSCRS